jgi:hypothetical protein
MLEIDISQFLLSLPKHSPLRREDLLVEALRLHRDASISVYFAPFDRVNAEAKIALIGITPGFQQMELLLRGLRDAVPDAHLFASFGGPYTRRNLVSMLDALNIHGLLGIDSTARLFTDRPELLHTTSAIKHPVFRTPDLTQNYNGTSPHVLRHQFLRKYVTDTLATELASVTGALLVPLGKPACECAQLLCESGQVDSSRCLFGMPHPSGLNNGHRVKQIPVVQDELRRKAAQFLGRDKS